jgi:hypothetical protein
MNVCARAHIERERMGDQSSPQVTHHHPTRAQSALIYCPFTVATRTQRAHKTAATGEKAFLSARLAGP